jgi:hypothetical protein
MIKGRKQIHILRVKFIPLQNGGIPYVEGSSTPIKMNESCQSPNLGIFPIYCIDNLNIEKRVRNVPPFFSRTTHISFFHAALSFQSA